MPYKLTDRTVQTAKINTPGKPRKVADGNGLYLHIEPTGAKYWRYRYRTPDGREKIAALGVYPALSLADARKKHASARNKLGDGIDPVKSKREARELAQVAAKNSFESVARAWHERKKDRKSVV